MSLKEKCALGRCHIAKDLKACAACNEVLYCCKEHQIEHFKFGGHKMICPGKTKGEVLKFNDIAMKAHRYHNEKSWIVALSYYGAMLELTERSLGLFHAQITKILEAMSYCYRMQDKYEEAAQCLQRVLIYKEFENPDGDNIEKSKETFCTMGQMSEYYLKAGNLSLAKEILLKMEVASKESFGDDSFERGRCLCALGNCYDSNEEYELAIITLHNALALTNYNSSNTKNNNELIAVSNCEYNLAMLYLKHIDNDKKKIAKIHFQNAYDIKLKSGLEKDSIELVEIQQYITQCC